MGCKCNVPIGTFTLWHIYKALHLHMQCMQSLRSTYMPKMQPNYTLNWLMFCAIAQAGAAIVVLVLFIACLWSTIAPSYLLKHINTQFTYLPFWMVKRFFFHPVHRQIFDQVYGQTCALILTVIVFPLYIWDMNFQHGKKVLTTSHALHMLWHGPVNQKNSLVLQDL